MGCIRRQPGHERVYDRYSPQLIVGKLLLLGRAPRRARGGGEAVAGEHDSGGMTGVGGLDETQRWMGGIAGWRGGKTQGRRQLTQVDWTAVWHLFGRVWAASTVQNIAR
jgi:hypothetical protein